MNFYPLNYLAFPNTLNLKICNQVRMFLSLKIFHINQKLQSFDVSLDGFKFAIQSIGSKCKDNVLILVETTVPPGTCEKIVKPIEEAIPNTSPNNELVSVFPKAITIIPIVAIKIAIQTFKDIFSFKNKKPNNAVKNGIAAKQSKVIAALVFVIE